MVYHNKGGGCIDQVIFAIHEEYFLDLLLFPLIYSSINCFCIRYHEAGDRARRKVLELLRELSAELQAKINILVFASMLLVIAKALFGHVRFVIFT